MEALCHFVYYNSAYFESPSRALFGVDNDTLSASFYLPSTSVVNIVSDK